MSSILFLLTTAAFGQAANAFVGQPRDEVLQPSDLSWGLGTTVGSPAVIRHSPAAGVNFTFLFYETQTGAATPECPSGLWGVGLAYTSNNGTNFIDAGPVVVPGTDYYSCVAAHPTVVNTGANAWVVFFKAEQECPVGGPVCERYTGLGRVPFTYTGAGGGGTYNYGFSPPANTPVMSNVAQDMGYPKAAFVTNQAGGASQYRIAFGQNPDIFVASSFLTTSFTVPSSPVILAGDPTGWGADELFTPAVLCESSAALSIYPGGRTFGASYAMVTDQSLGKFTTSDYATATEVNPGAPYASTTGSPAFPEIRHADMVIDQRGGASRYGLYYSTPIGGGNHIYRVTTSGFLQTSMSDKRCP